MIDHCITALEAEVEEKRFRAYVTDALKAIADNTSTYIVPGIGDVTFGARMAGRWLDSPPEPEAEEDTRTAGEIAEGIWKRMRGE